jgi:hypothetical protein
MMRNIFLRSAAVAALALTSACANNNAAAGCIFNNVPQIAAVPPRMINPAPGATGLPASGFSVQIQFGSDVEQEALRLTDPNGASLSGSAFTPMVPPPPGPPPLPDHQAAVPQLAGHTTYAVFVDGVAPATTGCGAHGPLPFSIPIGTFTTM